MDFGYKKKHNFEFGEKTQRQHCPRCMRSYDEAIRDQVLLGEMCDDEGCVFKELIQKEIENSLNSQFCINCGVKFSNGDVFCTNCGLKR